MSKPEAKPYTRIAVTTIYAPDGMERTYSIEAPRDGFTTDDFFQACKQLALVVGYDARQVEKAFHG